MSAPASVLPLRSHADRSDASPASRRARKRMPRGLLADRLEWHGPGGLSERDLLVLALGGGERSERVADGLLERFGDLHALERASRRELCDVRGMGPSRVAVLRAGLALGRRAAATARRRGDRVRDAADVHRRLSPAMRHLEREVFVVLLLDARHRILSEVRIAEGGLTACAIHPREVLAPAVREGAAAVVFAHNHPSGDPTPSREDVALTGRLQVAADALGIRPLDHLVIGDGAYVSLAERGLLGRGR